MVILNPVCALESWGRGGRGFKKCLCHVYRFGFKWSDVRSGFEVFKSFLMCS